jgi:4-amino-4-deoxy-L-arabinose transferase-like glycosyltransferase
MSAGYRPFRDIFASQGPLLLDLLYPFYLAFGQTLTAARAGVVICSLVAIVGAAWTARQIAGPIAGLAAALILAISPTFLDGSRLALAEVPTTAPSLLALGCLLRYRRTGGRWTLATGAACCALALLIKPMAIPVAVPVAMLLLAPPWPCRPWPSHPWLSSPWPPRRWLADLLGFGLLVLAICAAVIMFLGPAGVWDNLGAYRGGAGHRLGADAIPNLRLTLNTLRQDQYGLFALAAAGALLGLWRRPVPTLALLAWAAAVLVLFAVYGDLADKHIVYLVPSVALLAAVGAGLGARAIAGAIDRARRRPAALLAAGIGAAGLLAYLVSLPAVYDADEYLLRVAPKVAAERRGRAADQEIAEIIRTRTPPDGWVLADDPLAAFWARRRVLPYLVDTSGTRIDAGSLTAALAVNEIALYRPSVIVTWPRRLGKLDELVQRLPELGYRLERSYELGWRVYVRE